MSYDLFSNPTNLAAQAQQLGHERDEQALRETRHKRNEDLGEQFDRLSLITNALWELLQQAWPGLTMDVLVAKMQEIDARDGLLDGSTHRPPVPCTNPACGAKVMPGRPRCQFCGADVVVAADPFIF